MNSLQGVLKLSIVHVRLSNIIDSKNIYLPFVLLSVTSLRSFEPFSWIIISETKKNIWNKFHGAEMLVDVNKLFVCCS